MDSKMGIVNVKLLLAFVIELGNVIDKMGRSTGASKYAALLMLIDEGTALGGVDFSQVVPEFKDLDSAEQEELLALVKEKLALADDKLEAVIVDGLGLVIELASVIEKGLALFASLKA